MLTLVTRHRCVRSVTNRFHSPNSRISLGNFRNFTKIHGDDAPLAAFNACKCCLNVIPPVNLWSTHFEVSGRHISDLWSTRFDVFSSSALCALMVHCCSCMCVYTYTHRCVCVYAFTHTFTVYSNKSVTLQLH